MKVTICDRCGEQTKSAHIIESKDLCPDCFSLWGAEYAEFKETFFNPIKKKHGLRRLWPF